MSYIMDETCINCDTVKCRYEHLDPETEFRLATDPTTEEEEKERQIAEEKREEFKKMLKEKKKQRRLADVKDRRKTLEAEKEGKAEKRAKAKQLADEKREMQRIAENKKRAEEKQKADEACSRIFELPGELQVINNLLFSLSNPHIIAGAHPPPPPPETAAESSPAHSPAQAGPTGAEMSL